MYCLRHNLLTSGTTDAFHFRTETAQAASSQLSPSKKHARTTKPSLFLCFDTAFIRGLKVVVRQCTNNLVFKTRH